MKIELGDTLPRQSAGLLDVRARVARLREYRDRMLGKGFIRSSELSD